MWRRGDGQPPPPSRGSHLRTRRVRASDRPAPEGGQIFPRGCQIFAPGRVSTRGHSWGQSFAGSEEEEEELIVSARHQIGSAAPARDVRRSDPKGGSTPRVGQGSRAPRRMRRSDRGRTAPDREFPTWEREVSCQIPRSFSLQEVSVPQRQTLPPETQQNAPLSSGPSANHTLSRPRRFALRRFASHETHRLNRPMAEASYSEGESAPREVRIQAARPVG